MIMASHYLKNNQGGKRDSPEGRKELYLLIFRKGGFGSVP